MGLGERLLERGVDEEEVEVDDDCGLGGQASTGTKRKARGPEDTSTMRTSSDSSEINSFFAPSTTQVTSITYIYIYTHIY